MKFLQNLAQQFAGKPIDWDELEESLIRADLGVPMTTRIIKTLQEREAWSLLGIRDVIKAVRVIVGVNGTGKTTSTAKLAHYLLGRGGSPEPPAPHEKARAPGDCGQSPLPHSPQVMLTAADTFRAAAIEQLDIWAKRLGVEMTRGQYGADPAALCYEAYQAAAKREIDFLLCDTAGRQHTKTNLMAELQKVKRTLAKLNSDAPDETLLVVDATTGSNALSQAREFHSAVTLTGLIVTKLDGSGKGGIVVAIQDELGIPTRFVGTGERLDDFAMFDASKFLAEMF